MTLGRSQCRPLGDNDGNDPALFISGMSNNLKKSDGCIAWAIPPLSKKTKVDIKHKAEADTNESSSAPAKKQKMNRPPVATHIIDYMDISFDTLSTTYKCKVPYLQDNPELRDGYDVNFHRQSIHWDDGEPIAKRRISRQVKPFIEL